MAQPQTIWDGLLHSSSDQTPRQELYTKNLIGRIEEFMIANPLSTVDDVASRFKHSRWYIRDLMRKLEIQGRAPVLRKDVISERILAYMREHDVVDLYELRDALGISLRQLGARMLRLAGVVRIDGRRRAYYKLATGAST